MVTQEKLIEVLNSQNEFIDNRINELYNEIDSENTDFKAGDINGQLTQLQCQRMALKMIEALVVKGK